MTHFEESIARLYEYFSVAIDLIAQIKFETNILAEALTPVAERMAEVPATKENETTRRALGNIVIAIQLRFIRNALSLSESYKSTFENMSRLVDTDPSRFQEHLAEPARATLPSVERAITSFSGTLSSVAGFRGGLVPNDIVDRTEHAIREIVIAFGSATALLKRLGA
jgi:hypothetical protein